MRHHRFQGKHRVEDGSTGRSLRHKNPPSQSESNRQLPCQFHRIEGMNPSMRKVGRPMMVDMNSVDIADFYKQTS